VNQLASWAEEQVDESLRARVHNSSLNIRRGLQLPGFGKRGAAAKADPFLTGPTPLEREMLLALTELVAAGLEARDITYWMHGSSLLDALRHYGPAPWKRDVVLGVFASSFEDIAAALENLADTGVHVSLGPLVLSPATSDRACLGRNCPDRWMISFARLRSMAATVMPAHKLHNAFASIAVVIERFDPTGESAAWKRLLGTGAGAAHRKALLQLLPTVRRRPFAHMLLPVPVDPGAWLQAAGRLGFGTGADVRDATGESREALAAFDTCEASGQGIVTDEPWQFPVVRLPCSALSDQVPVVLLSKVFKTAKALLRWLGEPNDVDARTHGATLASANATQATRRILASKEAIVAEALASRSRLSSGDHRPELELSLEVVADAVRGAHVLLLAQEVGARQARRGTCWRRLYGKHDLLAVTVVPRPAALKTSRLGVRP